MSNAAFVASESLNPLLSEAGFSTIRITLVLKRTQSRLNPLLSEAGFSTLAALVQGSSAWRSS